MPFKKGHEVPDEWRKIFSKTHKGKVVSEQTREKLRKANKGKSYHNNGRGSGWHHSEETKRKISEANKGNIYPPLSIEARKKISEAHKGSKNAMWKGGIKITGSGYRYIYKPEHPYATKDGYVIEHRLVLEKKLGKILPKNVHIHHINGIKTDNRIENLMIFRNNSEHIKYHHKWFVKHVNKYKKALEDIINYPIDSYRSEETHNIWKLYEDINKIKEIARIAVTPKDLRGIL